MLEIHRLVQNKFLTKQLFAIFFAIFSICYLQAEGTEHGNEASSSTHSHGVTEETSHHDGAEASAHGAESKKFDAGKMIFDHISDAHDWHLFGEGESSVSIPLPVILYSQSSGLKIFSSSNFHHGHSPYEGFKLNEEGHVLWENESNTEAIYDLSLSKNVVAMIIAVIFLLVVVLRMSRHYTSTKGKAPKGFYNLIEPLILFIRDDIAKPSIGHRSMQFMPLLLTIFFFIFVVNLFGLIPIFPGGANVTGNIAVTMVLALVVFITVTINGNKYYWKHILMPDVPKWMYIIIIPIEILGVVLKPFVLMLRLFANITAGHIIILGFFSLIFIFGSMGPAFGYAVSPLSVVFTVFMSMLELLVAFLQAFVFTLLSAIYIGMAVEEHHH